MSFTLIPTGRLVLRALRRDDVDGFLARRNDPMVAEYQNWTLPYPRERAERLVADSVQMGGPLNDEWWMLAIADPVTDAVFGDLAVRLEWDGRSAEIGYTLASSHWGKGYATEAVDALVDWLFDEQGVTRVSGILHPDNIASAMVLERAGFLFEGHTRLSYWVGDVNSDDWLYGMTGSDREAWRSRPRERPADVRLVPVTVGNSREVGRLRTHKTQERFVAPMGASFADALFPEIVDGHPLVPWMQAIDADGDTVGFVMVALSTAHHPTPSLWRLLIDRRHQRRGIGDRALDLVERELRAMGDTTLVTSWVEGRGSPRPFYERRGFVPTGIIVDGETEAAKTLD